MKALFLVTRRVVSVMLTSCESKLPTWLVSHVGVRKIIVDGLSVLLLTILLLMCIIVVAVVTLKSVVNVLKRGIEKSGNRLNEFELKDRLLRLKSPEIRNPLRRNSKREKSLGHQKDF
uniref:16 kDa protein n=1 Tax=Tobacco rattle virus (strain PLB) TaxID=33766 RepID=V13K_TRVPL|nr:RecName: Full=16 kDa protein [Tobacco rattle virus-PLB]AAA47080.1 13K protein [Pepper ringspot virus]